MAERRVRSLHWWISVALAILGLVTMLALSVQAFRTQGLVEHRIWRELLTSVTNTWIERHAADPSAPPPRDGVLQSWYLRDAALPPDMPAYLGGLAPGFHSTEGMIRVSSIDDIADSMHVLVTPVDGGRLVVMLDIAELEAQQNHDSMLSGVWGAVWMLLIAAVILWLHFNLVRPVKDLARRIRAIDPSKPGSRLPVDYRQQELNTIAEASNAHLERVERFMARERSLLEQASHEFRTPVAVVSGAVDVLQKLSLPESAKRPLRRIASATETLSETMVALLYLARERPEHARREVVSLHDLLPAIMLDHEHLSAGKPLELRGDDIEPTFIAAPEAMVRIAVGNLLRNAIENTADGRVAVSLRAGVVTIADSGSGFDAAEAARRYRDSLHDAAPARGQGLGIFLVARICDRFGWRLAIDSRTGSGTRARLDISASRVDDLD